MKAWLTAAETVDGARSPLKSTVSDANAIPNTTPSSSPETKATVKLEGVPPQKAPSDPAKFLPSRGWLPRLPTKNYREQDSCKDSPFQLPIGAHRHADASPDESDRAGHQQEIPQCFRSSMTQAPAVETMSIPVTLPATELNKSVRGRRSISTMKAPMTPKPTTSATIENLQRSSHQYSQHPKGSQQNERGSGAGRCAKCAQPKAKHTTAITPATVKKSAGSTKMRDIPKAARAVMISGCAQMTRPIRDSGTSAAFQSVLPGVPPDARDA
ncbi:Uncharacterised protein [Mobiluncus curtisii]|uniref:Uncharacterized protein n=1 Tax=Mobiluncus curtisii TaxID=2051 RepID=A0A2X3DRY6_9ACTO|nr:Uncharacterised protein [Mobiluncus curtisii]